MVYCSHNAKQGHTHAVRQDPGQQCRGGGSRSRSYYVARGTGNVFVTTVPCQRSRMGGAAAAAPSLRTPRPACDTRWGWRSAKQAVLRRLGSPRSCPCLPSWPGKYPLSQPPTVSKRSIFTCMRHHPAPCRCTTIQSSSRQRHASVTRTLHFRGPTFQLGHHHSQALVAIQKPVLREQVVLGVPSHGRVAVVDLEHLQHSNDTTRRHTSAALHLHGEERRQTTTAHLPRQSHLPQDRAVVWHDIGPGQEFQVAQTTDEVITTRCPPIADISFLTDSRSGPFSKARANTTIDTVSGGHTHWQPYARPMCARRVVISRMVVPSTTCSSSSAGAESRKNSDIHFAMSFPVLYIWPMGANVWKSGNGCRTPLMYPYAAQS